MDSQQQPHFVTTEDVNSWSSRGKDLRDVTLFALVLWLVLIIPSLWVKTDLVFILMVVIITPVLLATSLALSNKRPRLVVLVVPTLLLAVLPATGLGLAHHRKFYLDSDRVSVPSIATLSLSSSAVEASHVAFSGGAYTDASLAAYVEKSGNKGLKTCMVVAPFTDETTEYPLPPGSYQWFEACTGVGECEQSEEVSGATDVDGDPLVTITPGDGLIECIRRFSRTQSFDVTSNGSVISVSPSNIPSSTFSPVLHAMRSNSPAFLWEINSPRDYHEAIEEWRLSFSAAGYTAPEDSVGLVPFDYDEYVSFVDTMMIAMTVTGGLAWISIVLMLRLLCIGRCCMKGSRL